MFLLFLLSLKLTDFEAFVSCSRMMCPQPNCAQGQCAMRQGRCCETKCQPIKGLKGGRPGGLVGGSGGSEEVNCCGGGSACGFVHCAAIAPDKKGCVRPWMLPKKSDGTKMTLDDCKAGAKKAKDKGEYNDGQENDGPSRGSISRNTIKLGGRCSTSRTRGNRGRITPCESGAVCKITNKGNMQVDRPNSGLCVAKRGGGKNRGSYNDGSNNDNPSLGGHKGNSGVGAKCVKGFSEKGISMPCKFGLKCVATAQFCAGTCYGTCQGGGH